MTSIMPKHKSPTAEQTRVSARGKRTLLQASGGLKSPVSCMVSQAVKCEQQWAGEEKGMEVDSHVHFFRKQSSASNSGLTPTARRRILAEGYWAKNTCRRIPSGIAWEVVDLHPVKPISNSQKISGIIGAVRSVSPHLRRP